MGLLPVEQIEKAEPATTTTTSYLGTVSHAWRSTSAASTPYLPSHPPKDEGDPLPSIITSGGAPSRVGNKRCELAVTSVAPASPEDLLQLSPPNPTSHTSKPRHTLKSWRGKEEAVTNLTNPPKSTYLPTNPS